MRKPSSRTAGPGLASSRNLGIAQLGQDDRLSAPRDRLSRESRERQRDRERAAEPERRGAAVGARARDPAPHEGASALQAHCRSGELGERHRERAPAGRGVPPTARGVTRARDRSGEPCEGTPGGVARSGSPVLEFVRRGARPRAPSRRPGAKRAGTPRRSPWPAPACCGGPGPGRGLLLEPLAVVDDPHDALPVAQPDQHGRPPGAGVARTFASPSWTIRKISICSSGPSSTARSISRSTSSWPSAVRNSM